jgi:hypothetical protein
MAGRELLVRCSVLATLVVVLALAGGCRCGPQMPVDCDCPCGGIDPQLPADPNPCTKYCKVWVPPVYRDVPKVVQTCGCTVVQVPEKVQRVRFEDVCVKPRTCKIGCMPGTKCEQQAVQVRPGGFRYVQDGPNCWKYCYVKPCYQWCNKVVYEDGIEYCAESAPEYKTVARTEEQTVYRNVYVAPETKVQWVKEVYQPGHWEWRATHDCCDCICDKPCPTIECLERKPCRPATPALGRGCPRCN